MSAIFELLPADPDQLQAALVDYLDNLLHADLTPAPAIPAPVPAAPAPTLTLVATVPVPSLDWRRELPAEVSPAPVVVPVAVPVALLRPVVPEPLPVEARMPAVEPVRVVVPEAEPSRPAVKPVPRAPQRPEWLTEGCTCLAFQVGGLELLAPLVQLGQVIPLREPLHFLQGQPDIQLGVMVHLDRTLAVVDLARVLGWPTTTAPAYVLTLPERRVALAIDAIIGTQEISEPDIQLRGRRRGLIVGTHRESLRCLLDVTALRWTNGRPVL